jgi:hypothetical protein
MAPLPSKFHRLLYQVNAPSYIPYRTSHAASQSTCSLPRPSQVETRLVILKVLGNSLRIRLRDFCKCKLIVVAYTIIL